MQMTSMKNALIKIEKLDLLKQKSYCSDDTWIFVYILRFYTACKWLRFSISDKLITVNEF